MTCKPDEHDWRLDTGHDVAERAPRDPGAYGPYRVCRRCLTGHVLAPIAEDHPESMTRRLGPDVEAMLIDLDARLFPKEATR